MKFQYKEMQIQGNTNTRKYKYIQGKTDLGEVISKIKTYIYFQ